MHTIQIFFFLSLVIAEKPTKKPHDFFADLKYFFFRFVAWLAAIGNNGGLDKKKSDLRDKLPYLTSQTCFIMSIMTSQCHIRLILIPRIMLHRKCVHFLLTSPIYGVQFRYLHVCNWNWSVWRRWGALLYNLSNFCRSINNRCCLRSSLALHSLSEISAMKTELIILLNRSWNMPEINIWLKLVEVNVRWLSSQESMHTTYTNRD